MSLQVLEIAQHSNCQFVLVAMYFGFVLWNRTFLQKKTQNTKWLLVFSSCDGFGRQHWRVFCNGWIDDIDDLPLHYGVFISTNATGSPVESLQLTALQVSSVQDIFLPKGTHEIVFRIQDQLGLFTEMSQTVCIFKCFLQLFFVCVCRLLWIVCQIL